MSILVTGAAGFIGTNLVRNLLSNGEIVIGVDNLRVGIRSAFPVDDSGGEFMDGICVEFAIGICS